MNNQRGGVSIFIVVFTALLVTVVTASFVQIMMRNQRQATNAELSQRAYDSAMAGVEDAKRALVVLKKCSTDSSAYPSCGTLQSELSSTTQTCDVLGKLNFVTFNTSSPKEVEVGKGLDLDQAYTCVKTKVNTDSYVEELDKDESVLIPLDAVAGRDVKSVKVSWFEQKDIPEGTPGGEAPALPESEFGLNKLPPATAWNETKRYPALLRSQLIQFSGPTDLTAFDELGSKNARTLFLYPGVGGLETGMSFNDDERLSDDDSRNEPRAAKCETTPFASKRFACSTIIELTDLPGAQQFLQLSALYSKSSIEVQLCDDATSCAPTNVIDFDNVQPEIDSTGRAGELFRRVKARVTVTNSGLPTTYPTAALNIGKSLCKDFFVTNSAADYSPNPDASMAPCYPSHPSDAPTP